jgi:hypothetical protein
VGKLLNLNNEFAVIGGCFIRCSFKGNSEREKKTQTNQTKEKN